MSTGKAAAFTAGLVQMRSGLSPQANLDAAVRLVEEAKRAGADYVLTSGATVDACSRALLRAGAASVDVLVFARVVAASRPPI